MNFGLALKPKIAITSFMGFYDCAKVTLLAVLVLVGGCAPQNEYVFAYQGPAEDLPAFVAAASEWNACGSVSLHIAFDADSADVVVRKVPNLSEHAQFTAGYTDRDPFKTTRVTYIHQEDKEVLRMVFAHEMGHAMGLKHTDGGLMAREPDKTNGPPHVSQEDCEALATR